MRKVFRLSLFDSHFNRTTSTPPAPNRQMVVFMPEPYAVYVQFAIESLFYHKMQFAAFEM